MGHKVRAIKSFCNWFYEEGILDRNLAVKLTEPKVGKRIPKALTIDELELLRDSCESALEHAIIEFSFATGCRVAEIQQINRTDIDWQRRAVTVHGKGDMEREVYFGARSRIWLQRYMNERTDHAHIK